MTWRELETAAPVIARLGRERLERAGVALLATVREDGSPRISPVEPYLSQGQLLFGAMSWSLKTRDLVRDPRCTLHSAITGPDNAEGELKLHGRAITVDPEVRAGCPDGWWHGQSPPSATVFAMTIQEAAFVSWDTQQGRMTVLRWSPGRGLIETSRTYP